MTTDIHSISGRATEAFVAAFSEGLIIDADDALRHAVKDLCLHLAAEIIAWNQFSGGMSAADAAALLTQAWEGKR